jgi:putative transposase
VGDFEVAAGEPSKPDQNAFVERFNRTYREEVLDAHLFDSIDQVRDLTESWIPQYNEERPHDSLGRVPPLTFIPRKTQTESTCKLCA